MYKHTYSGDSVLFVLLGTRHNYSATFDFTRIIPFQFYKSIDLFEFNVLIGTESYEINFLSLAKV